MWESRIARRRLPEEGSSVRIELERRFRNFQQIIYNSVNVPRCANEASAMREAISCGWKNNINRGAKRAMGAETRPESGSRKAGNEEEVGRGSCSSVSWMPDTRTTLDAAARADRRVGQTGARNFNRRGVRRNSRSWLADRQSPRLTSNNYLPNFPSSPHSLTFRSGAFCITAHRFFSLHIICLSSRVSKSSVFNDLSDNVWKFTKRSLGWTIGNWRLLVKVSSCSYFIS